MVADDWRVGNRAGMMAPSYSRCFTSHALRRPGEGRAGGPSTCVPTRSSGIRRVRNTRKDAVTYTGAFGVRRTPDSVPAVLPRSVVRRSSGRRHNGPAKECHRWAHTRVGVGRPLEAAAPRAVGLLKTRVQRVAGSSQFDRTAAIDPSRQTRTSGLWHSRCISKWNSRRRPEA